MPNAELFAISGGAEKSMKAATSAKMDADTFAAVRNFKAAFVALERASARTNPVIAAVEDRIVERADLAEFESARAAYAATLEALGACQARTLPGVRAVLAVLATVDQPAPTWVAERLRWWREAVFLYNSEDCESRVN